MHRRWVRLSGPLIHYLLHTVSILVMRLISCSMWSNKAAAHCIIHCLWHLKAIYGNMLACVSCHLVGSYRHHAEVSEDEAAELCERVSELLWRPSTFVSQQCVQPPSSEWLTRPRVCQPLADTWNKYFDALFSFSSYLVPKPVLRSVNDTVD